MVGITTYIRTALCHNTNFTRQSIARGSIKNSAAGLRLGRALDRAFTARVRGKRTGVEQARLAAVFNALRQANITVTGSQVPVHG